MGFVSVHDNPQLVYLEREREREREKKVKRRHQYDLQHLREPFIERHMFDAIEGSTIHNSVRVNNHSSLRLPHF
jgi:hypothetical protein